MVCSALLGRVFQTLLKLMVAANSCTVGFSHPLGKMLQRRGEGVGSHASAWGLDCVCWREKGNCLISLLSLGQGDNGGDESLRY